MKYWRIALLALAAVSAWAQESESGFDLRATVSASAISSDVLTRGPRFGAGVDGGFRSVLYPTLKLSKHWAVSGAFELYSRPYFYDSLSTQGHGVKSDLLQANISWSDFWERGSVVVRAGQLSTAFGSFLLHYDDADNALVDKPKQYGYYYAPVSLSSVAGVQVDVTQNRWDARAQFANSSPANPRSLIQSDQYGNWAGGLGYTVRQGFRIGVSGYRGPYLDRQSPYYFRGEAKPGALPARAIGLDVQWAGGPWNIQGELQRFRFSYQAIPTFREHTGYLEVKRTLGPRWYVAGRGGYTSAFGNSFNLETAAGFRPDTHQIVKVSYEFEHFDSGAYRTNRTFALQLVTSVHPLALVRN